MSIDRNQVAAQVKNLQDFSYETTAEVIKEFLIDQPESQKGKAVREIQSAIKAAGGIGLPEPTQRSTDAIWLIVISAFSIVLIGTFFTLAMGVFFSSHGSVKPELILTLFTGAVGFLAGLFAVSPTQSHNGG